MRLHGMRLGGLLCLALLALGVPVRADVGVITDTGTFTTIQQSHFIPLFYPSICSVTISGGASNITIQPSYSTNGGSSTQAATSINGGVISANGTYSGTIPYIPSQNINGFVMFQTNPSLVGTVNYSVTCSAVSGTTRVGTQTLVPADGSATFSVTYSSALVSVTNAIVMTPSAYSGADNAVVSCRITSVSLSGFSGICAGGVSGSTASLYYIANGT